MAKAATNNATRSERDATEEEDWLRQRLKAALARAAASDRNRTMLLQQGRDLQNEVASLKQRGRNQTLVAEQELEHAEHAKHVAVREQRYALELQRSAAANQSKLQSALVEARATSNGVRRNETKAKTLVHEVEEQEKQLQAALKNETTWANKTIASMQRAKAVAIAEEQARLQNASVVEEGLREQLAEAHAMTAAAAAKAHKAQQQAEEDSRERVKLQRTLTKARASAAAGDALAKAATNNATRSMQEAAVSVHAIAARAAADHQALQLQVNQARADAAVEKKHAIHYQHQAKERATEAQAEHRREQELLEMKNQSQRELESSQEVAAELRRDEQSALQQLHTSEERLNQSQYRETTEQKREAVLVLQRQRALDRAASSTSNAIKARGEAAAALNQAERALRNVSWWRQQAQELGGELNGTLQRLHRTEKSEWQARNESGAAQKLANSEHLQVKKLEAKLQTEQASNAELLRKLRYLRHAVQLQRQVEAKHEEVPDSVRNVSEEKSELQQRLNGTLAALARAESGFQQEAAELQRQRAAQSKAENRAAEEKQKMAEEVAAAKQQTADAKQATLVSRQREANASSWAHAAVRSATKLRQEEAAAERALAREAEEARQREDEADARAKQVSDRLQRSEKVCMLPAGTAIDQGPARTAAAKTP